MKKLAKSKKGGVVLVLSLLLALFLASICFLIFVQVVAPIIDVAKNNSAVAHSTQAMTLITRIEKLWYFIPILLIILLVIWAINKALYKEPLSGY